jgi:DNA-binding phage protein
MSTTIDNTRTWIDVKSELKNLFKTDGRSISAIIRKAGMSRDTYYKLDDSAKSVSPLRKSTTKRLAKALNVPCVYYHGFPYFDRVHLKSETLNGITAGDLIIQAAGAVGVAPLADTAGIPTMEFRRMLDSDPDVEVISFKSLKNIVKTLGYELAIVGDNSLALIDKNTEYSKKDSPIMGSTALGVNETDSLSISGISDRGLLELFAPDNLAKHNITEQELKELGFIHSSRKSHGTISQWINILYSIRGLDPT